MAADPNSNQDPNQFVQDTNRWSFHAANDPYGGEVGAYVKKYYDDPNVDPNAAIKQQVDAFRSQYGDLAPGDDMGVLQMIATGQRPQAPQQSVAAQWNGQQSQPAQNVQGVLDQTSAQNAARNKELYDELLKRARGSLEVPVDDPIIRGEVASFNAAQQRTARNYLQDLAEKSGPYANLRGEQRMMAEKIGQSTAGFQAELRSRELTARRAEIAQAFELLKDTLTVDEQLQVQRELALMDDAIAQQKIGVETRGQDLSMDQFLRDLALRTFQAESQDYALRAGL